jgi:hypothetical protein
MSPNDVTWVAETGIDIEAHTQQMSAHKPIYIKVKFEHNIPHESPPDPPLPSELKLSRDEHGTLVHSKECEAMNDKVGRFIEREFGKWKEHPMAGSAERLLYQMETISAQAVAEEDRKKAHLFRGKPRGWSPLQILLYAQLGALVEIKRCLFGLHGKRQWRPAEVARGIKHITKYWRQLQNEYKDNLETVQDEMPLSPSQ